MGYERIRRPRSARETIDLTGDDSEPESKLPHTPQPSRAERKRTRSEATSDIQDDQENHTRDSCSPAKRRRTALLDATRSSETLRAIRFFLTAEEIELMVGGRKSIYLWDRGLKTWKSTTAGYCMTPESALAFLACVKVRPKGDQQPLYLLPENIDGRVFYSGRNIDGWTIEVTLSEVRGMICDPQEGFYGYVVEFV